MLTRSLETRSGQRKELRKPEKLANQTSLSVKNIHNKFKIFLFEAMSFAAYPMISSFY